MKYDIIKNRTMRTLIEEVNNKIQGGWEIVGPATTFSDQTDVISNSLSGGLSSFNPRITYMQTLVFKTNEKSF